MIGIAKSGGQEAVLSIFVNPTQFGPNEDFERYPRREESDLKMAEAAGVDICFIPPVGEMYPHGREAVKIHIDGITERFEGEYRPGHFDGVATVVAKLCHIVNPNVLYLGQKDLQQAMVVHRMIDALNEPYALELAPTIREDDGLAMSSRNVYLSHEERSFAPILYKELRASRQAILDGQNVHDVLSLGRNSLEKKFNIQYFELIQRDSFASISQLEQGASLIFAGYLGKTRLIDNIEVS